MTYTIAQYKNYIIDCLGYSEQDLDGLTKIELDDLIDDKFSLNLFTNN